MRILLQVMVKLIILFLLAAACALALWRAPGDYNHDLAALVNKRDMLISSKPPRIIFIGGSNLITLDSAHIEAEINKGGNTPYSVVNMGLWGGLSMEQYLDGIKPYLAHGDIIVICQEYGTMLSEKFMRYLRHNEEAKKFFFLMGQRKNLSMLRDYNEGADTIKNIILLDQLKVKTYLHALIDGEFSHTWTGGFYRYARNYDSRGSRKNFFKVIRPLGEQGIRFEEPAVKNLHYLKKFALYADSHNMRMVFSFPPYPDAEYRLNRDQIESLVRVIRDDLRLDVLTPPETAVFPESCFADTVNHLQPRCEKIRTAALIASLRKIMSVSRDTTTR